MLDDFNLLHKLFPDELRKVTQEMCLYSKPQMVVLSSSWSEELVQFINKISDPALIVTCAIEAAIRAKVYLVSW